jgi:hypothetical protein
VFAIISLALGIGANTAIYSFRDALLLRSLPVGDPDVARGHDVAQQACHQTQAGEPSRRS